MSNNKLQIAGFLADLVLKLVFLLNTSKIKNFSHFSIDSPIQC